MKLSLFMVLVAGLLPILCAGIAKSRLSEYDNHHPREWFRGLTGWRARADAAQSNSLEAFPFFAVGVLAAWHAGADAFWVDQIASAFVIVRLAYIACYLADRASLRSLVWVVGHGLIVTLYILALRA